IDEVIDDKAENIAKVLKELDGQTLAISAEIKRLQERKATLENNSRNLKGYLQAEMEKVGKEKIKTELFSISIQNNPPSVY
ncbi:siphovirus Gp157 family protein, partial [Salmonella enterica]|nr:siphovirus Gp157 family protein [Salmonella enterica]